MQFGCMRMNASNLTVMLVIVLTGTASAPMIHKGSVVFLIWR